MHIGLFCDENIPGLLFVLGFDPWPVPHPRWRPHIPGCCASPPATRPCWCSTWRDRRVTPGWSWRRPRSGRSPCCCSSWRPWRWRWRRVRQRRHGVKTLPFTLKLVWMKVKLTRSKGGQCREGTALRISFWTASCCLWWRWTCTGCDLWVAETEDRS